MKRLAIHVIAFALISVGGFAVTSPGTAAQVAEQAKCGDCEGLCCGTNKDGTCWASDVCPVPEG